MNIAEQIKSFHTVPVTELTTALGEKVEIDELIIEAEEKAIEVINDGDSKDYNFVDGSVMVVCGLNVSSYGRKD